MDEDGNTITKIVDSVDPEVISARNTLNALLFRQKGTNKACISLEEMITSTIKAVEEYSQSSVSVEKFLNEVEAIRGAEISFAGFEEVLKAKTHIKSLITQKQEELDDAISRMRELSSFVKKVPQLGVRVL